MGARPVACSASRLCPASVSWHAARRRVTSSQRRSKRGACCGMLREPPQPPWPFGRWVHCAAGSRKTDGGRHTRAACAEASALMAPGSNLAEQGLGAAVQQELAAETRGAACTAPRARPPPRPPPLRRRMAMPSQVRVVLRILRASDGEARGRCEAQRTAPSNLPARGRSSGLSRGRPRGKLPRAKRRPGA
jgi:hypothetical protein